MWAGDCAKIGITNKESSTPLSAFLARSWQGPLPHDNTINSPLVTCKSASNILALIKLENYTNSLHFSHLFILRIISDNFHHGRFCCCGRRKCVRTWLPLDNELVGCIFVPVQRWFVLCNMQKSGHNEVTFIVTILRHMSVDCDTHCNALLTLYEDFIPFELRAAGAGVSFS